MRTPKRDFEIFSLSAMDLFCSAMGAFIVICIALFPFYGKTSTAEDVQKMKETIAQQEQQIQKLEQTVTQLQVAMQTTVQLAVLGIASKKSSFVIVVDLSASMEAFTSQMTETCKTLIESMKDQHQCQIICFHHPAAGVTLPRWQPGNTLAPMSAANRQSANAFIATQMTRLDGGTPTLAALEAALATPAEAIFLLTDGAPNPPQGVALKSYCDSVVAEVTRQNNGRAEIHCIAIGEYGRFPELVPFLTDMCKANKGTFLGVSK